MLLLTLQEIERRLAEIRTAAAAGQDEEAHSAEDNLWELVLRAIAANHPMAGQIATLAVTSTEIKFERWCNAEGTPPTP